MVCFLVLPEVYLHVILIQFLADIPDKERFPYLSCTIYQKDFITFRTQEILYVFRKLSFKHIYYLEYLRAKLMIIYESCKRKYTYSINIGLKKHTYSIKTHLKKSTYSSH